MAEKTFPAKILLFGEYSVIKNSMALSIPYTLFEGKLTFARKERAKDLELQAFVRFLKKMEKEGKFDFDFDISSLEFDIGQGLYFDSSIPQGFGVGSSGALCAAIYDRYIESRDHNQESTTTLKNRFSIIESHFHGASSGIDPLISYLELPILINKNEDLIPVELPASLKKREQQNGKGAIFLLNTGRSRKTEPLVNLFLEKCKSKKFNEDCLEEILSVTNNCITSFLEGRFDDLQSPFEKLSNLQFKYFLPMIPTFYQDVWKAGLENGDYLLKLCGAGGGGFLLGYCEDFKKVSKLLEDHEIRPLFRF